MSVTDAKLEELLKVKGVEVDIPISNPKDKQLLGELTGKSKYKGFSSAGLATPAVVFISFYIKKQRPGYAKPEKYVGSSNLLRRSAQRAGLLF